MSLLDVADTAGLLLAEALSDCAGYPIVPHRSSGPPAIMSCCETNDLWVWPEQVRFQQDRAGCGISKASFVAQYFLCWPQPETAGETGGPFIPPTITDPVVGRLWQLAECGWCALIRIPCGQNGRIGDSCTGFTVDGMSWTSPSGGCVSVQWRFSAIVACG